MHRSILTLVSVICLVVPQLSAQPAIGAKATAYVKALGARYDAYTVDVRMTTETPLDGLIDTLDVRFVKAGAGQAFDLIRYGINRVVLLHGDSLMASTNSARDSFRFQIVSGRYAESNREYAIQAFQLPDNMTFGKWRRVAPAVGQIPDGAALYRRSSSYKAQRYEGEITVAADGLTVIAAEGRSYLLGELESRTRSEFNNWRFDDRDTEAVRLASFSRERIVPYGASAQMTPRGQPAASSAGPALAEGAPVPQITGANLAGDTISAPAGPAVYFFSFIACQPCAAAMERFQKNDFRMKDGARLVYVNSIDAPAKVEFYLKRKFGEELPFDVLLVGDEFTDGLGVTGYPRIVVVDADGVITDEKVGTMPWQLNGLLE